jgi:hypothetical protein
MCREIATLLSPQRAVNPHASDGRIGIRFVSYRDGLRLQPHSGRKHSNVLTSATSVARCVPWFTYCWKRSPPWNRLNRVDACIKLLRTCCAAQAALVGEAVPHFPRGILSVFQRDAGMGAIDSGAMWYEPHSPQRGCGCWCCYRREGARRAFSRRCLVVSRSDRISCSCCQGPPNPGPHCPPKSAFVARHPSAIASPVQTSPHPFSAGWASQVCHGLLGNVLALRQLALARLATTLGLRSRAGPKFTDRSTDQLPHGLPWTILVHE